MCVCVCVCVCVNWRENQGKNAMQKVLFFCINYVSDLCAHCFESEKKSPPVSVNRKVNL